MCLLGFVAMLSSGMINPILPIYAKTLDAPYWLIGLTVSSFFVARTICEIPAGVLYHRVGWRLPIFSGMVIQTIAATSVYLTNNIYALVLARAIHGVGSTLFFLTAVSYIASASPKGSHGRFVGTFQGLEWVGNISGSVIGGFIAESLGAKAVFLCAALIQALGAVMVIWLRHRGGESTREPEVTEVASRTSWLGLLKMPPVYVASTAIFFIMFGYQGLVNTILPIYVTFELGFSLVFLGVLAMSLSIGQTIAMFVGGELADRLGYKKVLGIAMALSAVSSPMFGQLRTMEQLILLSVVFGITRGIGLTVPIALVGSEVGPMQVASAMAVYRTLMDIGGVIGPSVLAGSTEVYGYPAGFMLAGVVMLVPLTLLARLRPSQERAKSAP